MLFWTVTVRQRRSTAVNICDRSLESHVLAENIPDGNVRGTTTTMNSSGKQMLTNQNKIPWFTFSVAFVIG